MKETAFLGIETMFEYDIITQPKKSKMEKIVIIYEIKNVLHNNINRHNSAVRTIFRKERNSSLLIYKNLVSNRAIVRAVAPIIWYYQYYYYY